MQAEWHVQRRAERCTTTHRPFESGEIFHTLLFQEKDGLRREDLSEEAWQGRSLLGSPFSQWQSKFESQPPSPPEALPKKGAEELLRRLMLEDREEHLHARYILALMLERKKVFKPVDEKATADGRLLIYEHAKTGEIYLIHDPMLRLDQISAVQDEVFALIRGGAETASANPE